MAFMLPIELMGYVEVEPGKGFILKGDAPDDVRALFDEWASEYEEATANGIHV